MEEISKKEIEEYLRLKRIMSDDSCNQMIEKLFSKYHKKNNKTPIANSKVTQVFNKKERDFER